MPTKSATNIILSFFQPSIKYQIIVFLLDKEDVSTDIVSKLLISEATLNRHLITKPPLLAEFGIAIKSSRLKGKRASNQYFTSSPPLDNC